MDLQTELNLRLDRARSWRWSGLRRTRSNRELLRSQASRILLHCCSRQLGKSTTTALVSLNEAYLNPDALILLSSKDRTPGWRALPKRSRSSIGTSCNLVATTRDLALTLELAEWVHVS